ncbi:MAG: tRNA lysidine(34) synthetase, partial [Geminicoccaceae bacterium]
ARIARYGLLQAACRGEGILNLLLGHHYEDQAETVAMRVASGSGDAGLAGMAAVREVHGLRLLRPLLAVPKARLVATLSQAGWPWLVDPSNTEPQFARSRLRQDPHFAGESHWRRGYDCAISRSASDRWLADWLARNARPHALGFVRLGRRAWGSLAADYRVLVLERVLRAVAGLAYPPRIATLRRLVDDQGWRHRTAGGCLVGVAGGALLVVREPGRIRERLLLGPGETRMWDGRFLIRHAQGRTAVELAALGAEGVHVLPGTLKRTLRAAGVPAAALVGVPAAWAAGELVACPTLDDYGFTPSPGFSITVSLRPAHPLAGPPFAGVNVVSKLWGPIYREGTERDQVAGMPSLARERGA